MQQVCDFTPYPNSSSASRQRQPSKVQSLLSWACPRRESDFGYYNHVTSARALCVERVSRAPLCVGACVNWHVTVITRKLRFAQLRIGIISDHVIAASAGQRERSRSGSATGHFLHFFVVFLFFASSSYY